MVNYNKKNGKFVVTKNGKPFYTTRTLSYIKARGNTENGIDSFLIPDDEKVWTKLIEDIKFQNATNNWNINSKEFRLEFHVNFRINGVRVEFIFSEKQFLSIADIEPLLNDHDSNNDLIINRAVERAQQSADKRPPLSYTNSVLKRLFRSAGIRNTVEDDINAVEHDLKALSEPIVEDESATV